MCLLVLWERRTEQFLLTYSITLRPHFSDRASGDFHGRPSRPRQTQSMPRQLGRIRGAATDLIEATRPSETRISHSQIRGQRPKQVSSSIAQAYSYGASVSNPPYTPLQTTTGVADGRQKPGLRI